jgi:hypothetical protein
LCSSGQIVIVSAVAATAPEPAEDDVSARSASAVTATGLTPSR